MEPNNELLAVEALEIETIQAIFKGQKDIVINLYSKIAQLFMQGSEFTRSLIANKFVYPLSQLLEMNYSWGKEYLNLFPKQLKAEYYRQVYSSGV